MAERTNPIIKLNGVPIARSYAIDFIEGSDIEISIASTEGGAEITITSTGNSGPISHADLSNVTANQHHNQAHAVNGADHSGTLDDSQIPATIARDTEVSTAVSTHEAAADPHSTYLTAAEGNAAYEATGTVATHAAAADPHSGYLKESNTIDFLVGTATTELAGEIVVGGTPGGELGNTWASPTVDASHSGSTHAATQAAAEATAAAANTSDIATHAGLADPHTGYLKESNTIDFLVGTATAELAGEVVVGTSPGGELGGTWASPTVDVVHSGSAHPNYAGSWKFS